MKYAIIQSGGKQYRCVEGGAVEVDRISAKAGDTFVFDQVLLLADGGDISVGAPVVDGARVTATVVDHLRGPKLMAFRYKAKERVRKKRGHRQGYTRLQVNSIGLENDRKDEQEG